MTKSNGIDWEAVYWEQTPRLYNYFRYRTGDGDAAQDLTAQTMTRAWRYRHRYRHDLGAFGAWLFQIARNLATDYLRQVQQIPLPLETVLQQIAPFDLEAEVQKREDAARLYALLETLPPREQEMIALKYGAELTNRAIAQVMNLSESNVGTTLHRTLKRLRVLWEAHDEPTTSR